MYLTYTYTVCTAWTGQDTLRGTEHGELRESNFQARVLLFEFLPPHNLTELEQFCTEEWANITQSRSEKLVETYPNRLTAIIAVKGASTKY